MYEEAKSDGRISGTSQHTGGPIIISLAAEVMDQDASLIKQAQRLLSNDAVQKQMSGVRKQREFEPVSDFLPRHAARLVGRQAVRGAGSESRRKLDCQKTGIVYSFKNKIILKIIFKNILPRISIPTGTNLSQSDLLVDHRTTLNETPGQCGL